MPMADAFKSNWRRVKGEGFMGRMLSPSDLEHYQKRRAQCLLWRNLRLGRQRLLLAGAWRSDNTGPRTAQVHLYGVYVLCTGSPPTGRRAC